MNDHIRCQKPNLNKFKTLQCQKIIDSYFTILLIFNIDFILKCSLPHQILNNTAGLFFFLIQKKVQYFFRTLKFHFKNKLKANNWDYRYQSLTLTSTE